MIKVAGGACRAKRQHLGTTPRCLIEAGILDPTKVTRYALQNAASVSGLLLTTEAMVAEAPKDDAPAMPDMGGMGGMGGMM